MPWTEAGNIRSVCVCFESQSCPMEEDLEGLAPDNEDEDMMLWHQL